MFQVVKTTTGEVVFEDEAKPECRYWIVDRIEAVPSKAGTGLYEIRKQLTCPNCGQPATEGAYGVSCDQWPLCEA
jgi:hypothetical protein